MINVNISTKKNYYISRSSLTPDSVTVLAEAEALDTIKAAYTDVVNIEDLDESTTQEVPLLRIKGAKLETQQTSMSLIVDQLTEEVINQDGSHAIAWAAVLHLHL